MNFDAIVQAGARPVAAKNAASSSNMLGQKDFLRLLTTQMQTQDPFDPVDNKEMLAQMAQFSSLAGLSEINDTLKTMLTKLDAVLGTTTDPAAASSSQSGTEASAVDTPSAQ
jgi:flagellar basal-body rod modification protein FlgD